MYIRVTSNGYQKIGTTGFVEVARLRWYFHRDGGHFFCDNPQELLAQSIIEAGGENRKPIL
jgi:hypothetical protein